jgi:anti-sigma regulatory factor (Ser/Thr protein kinase)
VSSEKIELKVGCQPKFKTLVQDLAADVARQASFKSNPVSQVRIAVGRTFLYSISRGAKQASICFTITDTSLLVQVTDDAQADLREARDLLDVPDGDPPLSSLVDSVDVKRSAGGGTIILLVKNKKPE